MSKPGRNDPCPCGSGKKYKKCCIEGAKPPSVPSASDARAAPMGERRLSKAHATVRTFASQMADFVEPLVKSCGGSPEAVAHAMNVGAMYWNLALLPAELRQETLSNAVSKLGISAEKQAEFLSISEMMIERHRLMFPEQHVGEAV